MNIIKKILSIISNLSRTYKILGVILVGGIIVFSTHLGSKAPTDSTTITNEKHVQVKAIGSFSGRDGAIPVTGKVASVSKANILAVSSGEIVSLSRLLGDHVVAGEIIANFENSSQRASVLQAQGAYDSAQASYAKATGSTAENSAASSLQATQGAINAKISANSSLRSAYASLDDAIHTKADSLFTNPTGQTPQFNLVISDSQLLFKIQSDREKLNALFDDMKNLASSDIAGTNLDTNIGTMITEAQEIESFLSELVSAANKAITTSTISATQIATYQSTVAAARTETITAIASLTTAKTAYSSALSSATIASNSANTGTTNDIASAQANVKSALGALDAAKANLEKTIIRAPISGTIISLSIARGDYVPSFTQVAQISNPKALEVVAYVTSDDAKTLAVGEKAVIDGSTNGVITFIAPAIDPMTGKIQIKIGVPGDQSALTDGDTVPVALARGTTTSTKSAGKDKNSFIIPIVAVKMTPEGPVVFTVSSSTLVSSPVVFGPILGGDITITKGVTADMEVVTDARGLSSGQKVTVDSPQ